MKQFLLSMREVFLSTNFYLDFPSFAETRLFSPNLPKFVSWVFLNVLWKAPIEDKVLNYCISRNNVIYSY